MIQITAATFADGVFKPDERLNLPPHSRVRLVVEPLEKDLEQTERERAWGTLERLWQDSAFDSQGQRLSRERLHERR